MFCGITGPPALCAFPVCGNEISLGGEVDEEVVVACPSEVVLNNATRKDTTDKTCSLSDILDCTRYSSLNKLIVTTGYVMRFVNNLRKRTKNKGNFITDIILTAEEFDEALSMWIKEEQSLIKAQDTLH